MDQFMNYWSNDLSACKLTINKTQNSDGDVEFVKSYDALCN